MEAGETGTRALFLVKVMKDASVSQLREKKSNWISSFILWPFEDHKQPRCQLNSLKQYWVQRAHEPVFKKNLYLIFEDN